jgi:hypothetical protein
MLGREFIQDAQRTICGAVIYTDQLNVEGHGQYAGNDLAQGGVLVVNGHYDRKFHKENSA